MMLPRLDQGIVLAEQVPAHVGIQPGIELLGRRKTHQRRPVALLIRTQVAAGIRLDSREIALRCDVFFQPIADIRGLYQV